MNPSPYRPAAGAANASWSRPVLSPSASAPGATVATGAARSGIVIEGAVHHLREVSVVHATTRRVPTSRARAANAIVLVATGCAGAALDLIS